MPGLPAELSCMLSEELEYGTLSKELLTALDCASDRTAELSVLCGDTELCRAELVPKDAPLSLFPHPASIPAANITEAAVKIFSWKYPPEILFK